jgi:hypothetical protein
MPKKDVNPDYRTQCFSHAEKVNVGNNGIVITHVMHAKDHRIVTYTRIHYSSKRRQGHTVEKKV